MATATSNARERLVEVATRLFYAEGIHTVGVDRVIAEAGVAKATLYAHFASKDELVATYLAHHSDRWAAAVQQRTVPSEWGPVAAGPMVLAAFDVLAERAASPGYRGCPFINAAAEFPGPGPVANQITAHRRRIRQTFSDLLGAPARDPALLAMIVALYDGAMSAAYLDHDPTVVDHARHGAAELLRRLGDR